MVIFLQVAFSQFVICNANFVNYRNICMYSSVILGDPGAISRVDKQCRSKGNISGGGGGTQVLEA